MPPTKETPPHDAGRDGVGLVVEAGVGGVGGHAGTLDETGDGVHGAGQGKDHQRGGKHVDAGDPSGLFIGAQSEHVLAEGGLVPDEPHHDGADHGDPHVVGDGGAVDLGEGQGAGDEVGIGLVQTGDGHAVVVAGLHIQQQEGIDDQLAGQGDDEGMQLELGHEEAVEGADGTADNHGR